ncbi:MAG: potassium transporter Kup, partial [Cellulomonadaceae bacterium]|nr:potassium transporter Kup [Cellulomonadaceae bacterium]
HTSREEGGQIYVPVVNWCLFAGVLLLVVTFQSSEHLATAYGLAVTGTLILTSALFLLLARTVWRVAPWKIVVFVALAGTLEVVFLAANLTKVVSGGWLPLIIALVVVTMMVVWRAGAQRLRERERELGGPIELFAAMLRHHRLTRVPGVAIYPHPNSITTPLALRSNVDFNQVVHEKVVLVRIVNENVPHIRHVDRVTIEDTGHEDVGIVAVSVRVGFSDSQDIPRGLALVVGQHPLVQLDLDSAHYFLSLTTIHSAPWSARNWRTRLFIWMAHNAADRTEVFHLPPERTVLMGASVDL